jgi:hypothetical protein
MGGDVEKRLKEKIDIHRSQGNPETLLSQLPKSDK